MADSKITALTAISTVDPTADPLVIVDVSDTSMAASGTTKKSTINQLLGAGGTATLASATITGDLTVDTNTLKVDSTNNRVGVNNATPSFPLDLSGIGSNTLFRLVGNLGTNIRFDTIRSFVSNRNWIVGCDEIGEGIFAIVPSTALGGSTFTNPVYKVSYDGIHTFLDGAGGTRMTINSTGNLAFPTGKGIDFSATPGTGTSELLNDYEEGTWTIGLQFGGASTGMTKNADAGKYTKIGNQVTVTGYIALSNKGSSTGNALITGLPFLINSYGGLSMYVAQVTFADVPMGYSNTGTFTIPLRESTNAGVVSSLTDADFANNSEIIFTMTYTV